MARWFGTFDLICVVLMAGCAAHADRLAQVREYYFAGNLGAAEALVDEGLRRGGPDREVWKLDRAILDLAAGRPKEAERWLREVRDAFDYLEQASAAEGVAAMLTDDTRLAYAGEDYEKILIRVFLALANLLADGEDALAYALQVNDCQERIIQSSADPAGQNPKLAYQRVALGAYLYAALREETHMNYDDAARGWARVVAWEPDFPYGRRDVERAARGRHSAPGCGVLYVLALVGRGPYKIEVEEMPTTVSLLLADRILSAAAKHTVAPTVAPVKVPKVAAMHNEIRNVDVLVDGRPAGSTATITDVTRIAIQQHEAVYPQIVARAVARRALKKGVFYAGKEMLGVSNQSLVNLGMDVAGIVWEATESADTRCWGLLPDRIQVLRLELPVGRHRIGLAPAGRYGRLGRQASAEVTIDDGRNTYLLAHFPTDRLVGRILVSGQPEEVPTVRASASAPAAHSPPPRQ